MDDLESVIFLPSFLGKTGDVSGENMVMFKSCPRCSGDRTLEHDLYGWYILCLTCGFVSYPSISAETGQPVEESKKLA